MRSLRLSLGGTVILTLLAGLSGAVMAQDEEPLDPMGASVWTATSTEVVPPDYDFAPVVTSGSGYEEAVDAIEGLVEASDPRISGRWRLSMDTRRYVGREFDGQKVWVWTSTSRIDNDDGAWVGTATGFVGGSEGREFDVLHGEGAYEGLTAVFRWSSEESTLEGVIIPGDLPPLPDPVEPPAE